MRAASGRAESCCTARNPSHSWRRGHQNRYKFDSHKHPLISQICVTATGKHAREDVPVQQAWPDAVSKQASATCERANLVRRNGWNTVRLGRWVMHLHQSGQYGVTPLSQSRYAVENGESLEFKDTVIVMGDCRRGSSVKSAGDVIVLGRLLGRVVAGAEDNKDAVVVAGEMQPHSIQIADVKLKPSYWHRTGYAFGQIAYVKNSQAAQGEQIDPVESKVSIVQELDKLLPKGESQDDADLDRPADPEAQQLQDSAQNKQFSIQMSPLARPYISFGPDVRQHPCAMNSGTQTMPAAAKSAAVTGLYALVLGFALMIAPVQLFSLLFSPAAVSGGFVRLGGALLALFGLYYIGATLGSFRGGGVTGFYSSTVVGRLMLAVFCVWLFFAGEVGAGILFFAAMNGAGALSMALALRKDNEPTTLGSYM